MDSKNNTSVDSVNEKNTELDVTPGGIILIEKEEPGIQLIKIIAWLTVMAVFVIFILHYTNSVDSLEVFHNKSLVK